MFAPLISRATDLLLSMYDEDKNLFSSSTRLVGSAYVNEHVPPRCFRYSTVSLMGLQQAFRSVGEPERFGPMLDAFAKRYWQQITSAGDLGVLCSLLNSVEHPLEEPVLALIETQCEAADFLGRITVQEICQLLSALSEMHARKPSGRIESLARRIRSWVQQHFCCEKTGFCFHSTAPYRRAFVSFGAMTYYIRSLYDFGAAFEDEAANRLYLQLVRRLVALQGARGEWPWFFNSLKGEVSEWYEIYSVHQHGMSFLFLFPAFALGHNDLGEAIRRSYRWVLGDNELGRSMVTLDPFFIYRSIRRRERHARFRRFARAAASAWLGRKPSFAPASSLEVNTECRSYEIGWLLYVWSNQTSFRDFHSLGMATSEGGYREPQKGAIYSGAK